MTNPAFDDDRITAARKSQGKRLDSMLRLAGLAHPPKEIFIRAFKEERELEVWARSDKGSSFVLVQSYPIAAMSGTLGPKRKRGDLQAPEGLYFINRYNAKSAYHLSLGLDYPNASDRIRSKGADPGSDIFIHGARASIGCFAMTDQKIEQIFLFAYDAHRSGQRKIRVEVYPFRMRGWSAKSKPAPLGAADLWAELKPFFDAFDTHRKPAAFRIDSKGRYIFRQFNPKL